MISEALINASPEPLVCASFCKRLVPDASVVDSWSVYLFLQFLYDKGLMAQYEVQSTGIKNFQTEKFLDEVHFDVSGQTASGYIAGRLIDLAHSLGRTAEDFALLAHRVDVDPRMLELEPVVLPGLGQLHATSRPAIVA